MKEKITWRGSWGENVNFKRSIKCISIYFPLFTTPNTKPLWFSPLRKDIARRLGTTEARVQVSKLEGSRLAGEPIFFKIFIVIQLQLSAFSPHPSTPPQPNPPPRGAILKPASGCEHLCLRHSFSSWCVLFSFLCWQISFALLNLCGAGNGIYKLQLMVISHYQREYGFLNGN